MSNQEYGKCCGNLDECASDDGEGPTLQEACAVFGCVAAGDWPTQLDIPQILCWGLVALQHRGQESAGIVTSKGDHSKLMIHKGMGLVSSIFHDDHMVKLKGNIGLGHSRYSTFGGSDLINCQPFIVHTQHGPIALGHNGELVNGKHLRKKVLNKGVGLSTISDSELITQLLSLPPKEEESDTPDWPARIRHLMEETPMAYSLVMMHGDKLYGIRDPYANRPLCLGAITKMKIANSGVPDGEPLGWVLSSESCAFASIGAEYVRDIAPGEIVQLSRNGVESLCSVPRPTVSPAAFCIFEYVYFARPDSIMEGQMVYKARQECGRQLAIESPVEADYVSSVPDSGTAAAHGYSKQSGIPFAEVLSKNRYVGRTFIQPSSSLRQLGVSKKFGALIDNCLDKRIILIDDSVVRGNTMGPIVKLLMEAGAREVHVRVASPPIKHPCFMGINIPSREELIANTLDPEQLSVHIGAASLRYLSVEGLVSAVRKGIKSQHDDIGHCTACLTGKYPVDLDW